MQNISNDDLDTVTGGTTGAITGGTLPPAHTIASAGTTGSDYASSGLLTSLNSISDSIKGLANHNNGLNSNTMLMFGMALAMRNRSEAAPVVVNYSGGFGGGGWHGGFSWHAHW